MNEAITDNVELNVLAEAPPAVPQEYKDSKFLFLANTAPALQSQLLEQIDEPLFVAADTMNCWISNHLDDLKKLLKDINALIINEDEARALAGDHNLIKAADKILEMGPEIIIIKRGDSGSMMCSSVGERFMLPAFPAAVVKDPTGAGDSFAGAFMGYLARLGRVDFNLLKTAVAYGTAAASFTISDFSLKAISSVSKDDLDKRIEILRELTDF